MQINPVAMQMPARDPQPSSMLRSKGESASPEMKKAFTDFVGQTMFGQTLASMRKSLDKPAYFHGGRAEEVFQSQLDQIMTEKLTDASAESFAGPMFDMFILQRS